MKNERDYGTIFTVKLPKGKAHFEGDGKTVVLDHPEELMATEGNMTELLSDEEYRQIGAPMN